MKIGILLAAGKSARYGADKLQTLIDGKPVLYHALSLLHGSCDEVFIACHRGNKKWITELVHAAHFTKVKAIFIGGQTRFESVKKSVAHISSHISGSDFFIVHNAANPHATEKELNLCLRILARRKDISGAAPGRAIVSTIKKINARLEVVTTVERKNLWEVETPQVLRAADFIRALAKNTLQPTDDLAVLEAAGMKTRLVQATPANRKITYPEDVPGSFLIGVGEDSHHYAPAAPAGQKLGGVYIKNMPRLMANSDGDLILHALCNAIGSAIGEGSLGRYADELCKNGVKDSAQYLKKVLIKMHQRNYEVYNCSIALEGSRPKIDPLAPSVKKSLARLLKISPPRIGITATSGENLTAYGKGEGLHCYAAVLLREVV